MFASINEENFFFTHLKDDFRVLEYGSGSSTEQISKKVKEIISIEHQEDWFNKLNEKKLDNCRLILKKPNLPYTEGITDGTYEEFKNYIESPLDYGLFDIILIDGRARVSCADFAKKISHKKTLIFVHDFNRQEYQEINNLLEHVQTVETMAKFKIKN
jgi:hypothetical protein